MNQAYDYIIIGAGSAGCVLANRLSKNPNNSVLLLESGGPDSNINIHIPGAYTKLHKTKVDWGFWTEPQTHILDRKIYLPRGKTLGGSSSTNAMAYVRGNHGDYNQWADLGNKGWSFEEVLPYFIKSENHQQIDDMDSSFHGQKGELNVTLPQRFKTPFLDAFLSSCQGVGIPYNSDCNGQKQEGVGALQSTIKEGKRWSAADAFLKPILKRKNLRAITRAHVQKINFIEKRAVSVQFQKGNKIQTVQASKEIILSAGAFQSPQILMLSGIGERQSLEQFNIECLHDLQGVGKNLQDHLICQVGCEANVQKGLNHNIPIFKQVKAAWDYFIHKKGAFNIGPLEAMAFLDIYKKGAPTNFQLHFTPMWVGQGYDYDMYDLNSFPITDGFTIIPTLLHPKSRGYVSLRSNIPSDPPIIQPNFLSHKEDLNQLVLGVKLAIEILKQPAFKKLTKSYGPVFNMTNNDEIIEHIKRSLETVYHPVGTCKMGHDDMAVVDHKLRVHGLDNIRVVDASIMPTIVSGNTNAPVYMIAEKASDMILEYN